MIGPVWSAGTRACLVLGLLVALFAAYRWIAPIDIPSPDGPLYRCGSGLWPAGDPLSRSVCGRQSEDRQLQSGFLAGAAVIIMFGGAFAFGDLRRRPRRAPHSTPRLDEPPAGHEAAPAVGPEPAPPAGGEPAPASDGG